MPEIPSNGITSSTELKVVKPTKTGEWFQEKSPMWPGQAFSLQFKKKLLDTKSKYQHIQIFETCHYGKMLVLDGVIQCTERDEASYQEMITFLPLNSHPQPKKILIIGGGDGGVVREADKHPLVEKIYHCEIDEEVIQASKDHIPSMGCGFSSKKLISFTGDGASFLESTNHKFDVIITDASDPIVAGDEEDSTKDGPAVTLFNGDYYSKMKERLTDDGILCCQGENMWLHSKLIAKLIANCRAIYPVVDYAYTCTPTYPGGQIGFLLCSKNPNTNFRVPITKWGDSEVDNYSLKYYNEDIHQASFTLPSFMRKILSEK